jgi:uncharacterized protein (DUF2236 family)
MSLRNPVQLARLTLATALRTRVAGSDAEEVGRRIWTGPGPRWFAPGSPIHVIHQDASMYVGGIRSLLLQSLHPQAMAGVAGHSGYRTDPWGRLQRTSTFIATTTYGSIDDAEAIIARVRGIHDRVRGKTIDGIPYAANDPHLLRWVHVAEVDSFLTTYRTYGSGPAGPEFCDEYVAQTALVAEKLGVQGPPLTVAELSAQLASYRRELHGTLLARDAAKFLLLNPPLPLAARPGYAMLAAAAVSSLPTWVRRELRLPRVPVVDQVVGTALGKAATSAIRWAMIGLVQAGRSARGGASGSAA